MIRESFAIKAASFWGTKCYQTVVFQIGLGDGKCSLCYLGLGAMVARGMPGREATLRCMIVRQSSGVYGLDIMSRQLQKESASWCIQDGDISFNIEY